ncbi:MAG: Ig-like domain-containing protein, partial [Acidimicrobiia bacterium]
GLTFSLEGVPPAGASIDPVSGVFSWTPSEAQGPGVYPVTVRVTDDGTPSLFDEEIVSVTVNEVNVVPVLSPIGAQSGDEGTLITFTATATDADVPANGLTFSLEGVPPAGASIDPVSGVFSWTPSEAQGPGVYPVTVRVTDDGTPNLSDDESFTVTVNEINQAPTVGPIADQSTDEGVLVSVPASASDPDTPANTLTWSATGLPSGLSINPSTGEISGIVDYTAAAGSPYSVTIIATDDGTPNLSGQTSFTWTVIDNLNPVANPDIYNLTEGTSITISAPGVLANDVDPENDPLTASLVAAPTEGTLTLSSDGSFTYVHQGPGSTDDSFIYQLSDGTGNFSVGVVTLEIDEANLAPSPADDSLTINEDTPMEIPVTANDTDPNGDPLTVTSVTQPSAGAAVITSTGSVRYVPSVDYWGTTSFTYTVSDGRGGEATATVNVNVLAVNDVPVAFGEDFNLTTYVTSEFGVLSNDWDPDGDPLTVVIGDEPEFGQATTDGRLVFFTPQSGWVGTVTFTYLAMDPSGARDAATVSVTVSQAVLTGAEQLAGQLGVAAVPFESPAPIFDTTELVMAPAQSITLIADAFYQTVQALRLPLSFLGLALLMLIGLGTATRVPFILAGARHRFWAVVLLDREEVLPAYSEPGGTKLIYNFDPTMSEIVSTGKPRRIGVSQWLPVDTPNGEGWVDRQYLTEQVDLHAFMADPRPAELVDRLAKQLRTGGDLTSLIAGRGLVVALTGPPTRIPPERLAGLLGESQLRRLHTVAGTLDAEDDFRVAVAEPFLEAYHGTSAVSAETPHSRTSLIPTELWNFPYLALGEQGVQPWLVFFEYRRGRAWIAALGIDE